MHIQEEAIDSTFFTLEKLAEGVYAAMSKSGTGTWSNGGFVDTGKDVIVFDAFSTPKAAMELRAAAEKLTGKKVTYLVNSHYHGDHTFGNQVFADTVIISTEKTKELIEEKNSIPDLKKEKQMFQEYLDGLEKRLETERDPVILKSLSNQFIEMKAVFESLDNLTITLPNLTFDKKLTFHGSERTAELYCFGGGHTPSDSFLYIPEEKIAFMGDLATEGLHFPIDNPLEFVSILEKVMKYDIQTVVPGHGEIGTKEYFLIILKYLSHLIETANSGNALEEFIALEPPEEYKGWTGVNGYKQNLSRVYTFLNQENS
ncbi:MBL fold metallo-hydrolase [Pseudalkalibacillus caeni]|nr:MBL fold metallo-hydrolase [Pseudalkalibacillus caeni]